MSGAGAILADPPCPHDTYSPKGEGRSACQHYLGRMTLAEIMAYPVNDMAAADSFLFLWVTSPQLPNVFAVITAWGFEYSSTAFCWVKPNKTKPGWARGGGHTTRKNIELCLLGRRGNPKRLSAGRPRAHRSATARASPQAGRSLRANRTVLRRSVRRVVCADAAPRVDVDRQRARSLRGGVMTSYTCPINNRLCRCNPTAIKPQLVDGKPVPDEKFRPCILAKRIGVLVRLLGSNFDGEATGAVFGLKRLLPAEGLTFNDLAILIENCNGAIEEKKYSDTDVEILFRRGEAKGRAEEANKKDLPPDFYDADGQPRWNEIALFCQKNENRLRDEWERTFVNDMAGKTVWRLPSDKQAKHLIAIFVKLGGYYDPKATYLRS